MAETNPGDGSQRLYDGDVRRLLLDRILVASAVVGVIAVAGAEWRACTIGFGPRDMAQLLVVSGLVCLALVRQRVAAWQKASALIAAYLVGGVSGFYTLGMFGGTVFFFPLAVLIVALFYPVRVTAWFAFFTILLCALIGGGFCFGWLGEGMAPEFFQRSGLHWFLYVGCLGLCLALMSVAVVGYRREIGRLVDQIHRQRDELSQRNGELVQAMEQVRRLSGLLPICSSCKKIRDDQGYWRQIEVYVRDHSEADFTHSICPECTKALYPEEYASMFSPANRAAREP